MKGRWQGKVLAMMTSVSMLLGMFSVNSFAVTDNQVAKDKEYSARAKVVNTTTQAWDGYDINVKVAVEDGKFSSVIFEPIGDIGFNQIYAHTAQVNVSQALSGKPATIKSVEAVDVKSGATCTADAGKSTILKLVKEAEAAEQVNPPEEPEPNDDELIYGTLNLPYADYYYGELNFLTDKNQEMNLEAADKASKLRGKGMYDAVSSATKNKAKMFALTYYEENSKTVEILGIKDVNVAISRGLYNKAKAAIKEGKPCNNKLLNFVKEFKLNKAGTPEPAEYKVLNGDGTLTATKSDVDYDYAARVTISTDSRRGNYLVNINSKKLPSKDDIEGILVTTSDGKTYGMEHLENIWFKTGEFAFAVKDGFVEPHGNKIDYLRHKDLEGAMITEVRYLLRNKPDLVVNTFTKCKKLVDKSYGVKVADAVFEDGVEVKPEVKTPEGTNYALKKVFKGNTLLKADEDYTFDGTVVKFKKTENTGIGEYKLVYEDSNFANLNGIFLLKSPHKEGSVKIKNNKLELPKDISFDDYADSISEVKLDGKRLKGRNIVKSIFDKDGKVNFEATLKGKRGESKIFTRGEGAKYEIEMISKGYPSVKGTLNAPKVEKPEPPKAVKVEIKKSSERHPRYGTDKQEVFDIYFVDKDGNKVEVKEKKKVTVTLKKQVKKKDLKIFHKKHDGKFEEINPIEVNGNKVTFENDSFSLYYFIDTFAKAPEKPNVKVEAAKKAENPATGDNSSAAIALILMGSALCLYSLSIKRKKNSK